MLKRILLVLGGVVVLLLLVATAAVIFVDTERWKPRLEAGASKALGMQVRLAGRVGLHLFPSPHVSLADGSVLDERGVTVASAKRVKLWIRVLPLLRGQFRLGRLQLEQPRIAIARESGGTINIEHLQQAVALLGMLDGGSAAISNGSASFVDQRTGDGIAVTGLDLRFRRVRFPGRGAVPAGSDLSLDGELTCASIRTKRLSLSDVRLTVTGRHGVFEVKPVDVRLFGGRLAGFLRADLTGPVPRYGLQSTLPRFRIEEFVRLLTPEAGAEGEMDFAATLSFEGRTWAQLLATASGTVSMRGKQITLVGNDLDRSLARYASSQSFNLVDVGAVFLAGPLGLAVTKTYSFASLFRGTDGKSDIRDLVSDWKIEQGVAQAQDVALATSKNRIALEGGLDFVNERFADVTVAVVDAHGCASVRQAIRGSFAAPEVQKPRFLMSLSGPVRKLVRQTRGLFPDGPCEAFYSGSVAPPG